jgi:hypothetical protein
MEKSSDKPAVLMQQDRSGNSGIESESGQRTMALAVIKYASVSDREILLRWARDLLQIRDSDQSALDKAKAAIRCTVESKAITPFVTMLGGEIKRIGWDERGLPARIGLSAAAIAAVAFSGKGAGIAALGGAIGVPLWVVLGAGGAFAGVLIEEIQRSLPSDSDDKHRVEREIDGEVVTDPMLEQQSPKLE